MGCDYYVQKELVIEYHDKNGRNCTLYTDRIIKKGYVFNYKDQDSDDNENTANQKYRAEIERKIKDNTYNKILFENNEWIKESYKLKYETQLVKTYKEIAKILKIYKKTSAWERM